MKSYKALATFMKALTCAAAVVTLSLFVFKFVAISGHYDLTGLQIAFGSKQTVAGETVNTYKSAWYWFAFMLSAASVVFSALNFKFKGSKYASVGFSLATLINAAVIFFARSVQKFFDIRPLTEISNSDITKEPAFLIFVIMAAVTFVISTVAMFVVDYAEVIESKGAKLTITKRVKNFFKDYKSEIKKIVWPSRSTVIRNVIVVLVMCAVVGVYIWLLDFGLAKLLGLILGI